MRKTLGPKHQPGGRDDGRHGVGLSEAPGAGPPAPSAAPTAPIPPAPADEPFEAAASPQPPRQEPGRQEA